MTAHKFVDFIYEQNKAPVSELADMAGVARNSICRWKNGTSPRLVDIDAVLGVLGYELVIARKHRPDYEPERMAIIPCRRPDRHKRVCRRNGLAEETLGDGYGTGF